MSIRKYWPITDNDVYVRIFDEILSEASPGLFDETVADSYRQLCPHSRNLITRMYLRAPKWVRFEDLTKYMPPATLKDTVLPKLIKAGWLQDNPQLHNLVFDVATQKELLEVAKALGLKTAKINKSQLENQLMQLEKQQAFFAGKNMSQDSDCSGISRNATKISEAVKIECYLLTPARRRFLYQLALMFLYPVGPDANLDVIFLSHMNKHRFLQYKYISQREEPIFTSRAALEAYIDAYTIAQKIEEAVKGYKIEAQRECVEKTVLQQVESGFNWTEENTYREAAYVYGRAMFNISQIFMKLHMFYEEYDWIQKYLCQSIHTGKRGLILIRKLLLEIRFLSNSQTKGESSWLLSAINTFYDARNEVNEIEMMDLQRKTTKLLASIRSTGLQSALSVINCCPPEDPRVKVPVYDIVSKPVSMIDSKSGVGTRILYEGGLTVEKLALAEYANAETGSYEGGHYEGSLLTTIFWLLSYDLLFQNPKQFRCAYQRQPLNLQKSINQVSAEIVERLSDLEYYVLKNRQELTSMGEPLPLVGGISWYIPERSLSAVLRGLGDKAQCLVKRLMSNYRKYSSGFPDLTLWNTSENKTKFVEVKSENDTVSDNQQLWMEFMLENGIDVEICKVLPTKRVVKRKRN